MTLDVYTVREFIEKHNNISVAAKHFKVSYNKMYHFARRNGIRIDKSVPRDSIEYIRSAQNRRVIKDSDIEIIKKLYSEENKSLSTIADMYNTSAAVIMKYLKNNNIKMRLKNGKNVLKPPKIPKDILFELYWVKMHSLSEIALLMGYNNSEAVKADMIKYDIPRRTYHEAGKNLYQTNPEYKRKILQHIRMGYASAESMEYINILHKNCLEIGIDDTCIFFGNPSDGRYEYKIFNNEYKSYCLYDFVVKIGGKLFVFEYHGERFHVIDENDNRKLPFIDNNKERYAYEKSKKNLVLCNGNMYTNIWSFDDNITKTKTIENFLREVKDEYERYINNV